MPPRLPWLLLLSACTSTPPSPGASDTTDPTVDPGETGDSGADTADTTDTADTADTGETGAPQGWNGLGAYRVTLTVAGYDPGDDGVDEGPAEVELDFAVALALLGIDGHADLRTVQVIREDADGAPLAPSVLPAAALGDWDVPYRLADRDLWSEGFAYNFAVTEDEQTLTFTHRQEGPGDTRYAVYFDVLADGADPAVTSPRPTLGDMDIRHRAEGYLASVIHARPTLADLDGDGLLDLVMGDSYGRVSLYRNEGTTTEPAWTTGQQLLLANGAPIQKNYLAIPDVVDWDGDGDLDLLMGSEYGAIVTFYANTGGAGTPTFEDMGTLDADGAELRLPFEPCPEAPFYTQDYTAAPDAVDWDGDGDLDLLLGGYVTGRIYLYERDGDTLTAAGPLMADGVEIDTSWAASPTLVDLDDDGDRDLLSGGFGWELSAEESASWPPFFAWENTAGAGAEPVFTAWEMDLRNGDVLAAGALAHVRDGDVDDDGDVDLLVAAEGYAWLFRNVGTASSPAFEYEDPLPEPVTPLPVGVDAQAVDVDGDGDLDLLSGGTVDVMWKENLGGADPPEFTSHEGFTAGGATIWHTFEGGDDTSFPVLEDWEGDGDLDLVVGTADGFVDLYRLDAGRPADGFSAGERLRLSDGTDVFVGEPMDPDDSFEGHSGNRAQPTSADLDGDGDRDLLVGDALGGLTLFENEGDDTSPRFAAGERVLTIADERLAPSLADWDGDGDADLLLGRPGSVWIYENLGGLALGEPTQVDDPTAYYPHPYAADVNGDGDLDLSISTSYGYLHVAERTWIERGTLAAEPITVESVDGAGADWFVETPTSWAYEGDLLPSASDPEWTPYHAQGSVSGGVLTLGSDESILLGTLFDDGGDEAWPGTTGTEVEVRLRVLALAGGQTDAISLAVSDGVDNWHLRWSAEDISFYGHADRHAVETTEWHTWRLYMGDGELTVCRDDDATSTWTSPPSLQYTRRAMWFGDDGAGTGGTTEIDWIRWTAAGDGDPCTGW